MNERKQMHCTICTMEGESAESARQKNDSANFYIGGMACREKDERRKGGIQSRGTTKKEEPEKEKPACSDC